MGEPEEMAAEETTAEVMQEGSMGDSGEHADHHDEPPTEEAPAEAADSAEAPE